MRRFKDSKKTFRKERRQPGARGPSAFLVSAVLISGCSAVSSSQKTDISSITEKHSPVNLKSCRSKTWASPEFSDVELKKLAKALEEGDFMAAQLLACSAAGGKLNLEVFPELLKAVNSKDSDVARKAVFILAHLNYGEDMNSAASACELLISLLKGNLKYEAAESLVILKQKGVVYLDEDTEKNMNKLIEMKKELDAIRNL